MAVAYTKFLAISPYEPNLDVGWIIKIRDYKDLTTLVSISAEYTEFSFTQELNAPGEGSVTFDRDSPFWGKVLENGRTTDHLLDNEYVFEAWENGVARFAWLGQVITENVAGADDNRTVTISGPGLAAALKRAIVNRPGWPTRPPVTHTITDDNTGKETSFRREFSANDKEPAYKWRFAVKTPSMKVWWTIFKAAQRRGVLPFISLQFTADKDSNRKTWKVFETVEQVVQKVGYQPETLDENLLDFLADCTGQDYSKWWSQRLEWIMTPGFKLYVRPTIGVNRSTEVRFFGGQILSDERSRDRENIANQIITVDVEGGESNKANKDSITKWGIRESRIEAHKNVTAKALRDQIAANYLIQKKYQVDQRTIKIPYDYYYRRPFKHFQIGDWVGYNDDRRGAPNGPTKTRVMAITIRVGSESEIPDCELTLESLQDTRLKTLEKKLTELINKPANLDLDGLTNVDLDKEGMVHASALTYDPDTKKWGATSIASLGGSGNRVFIQTEDPALTASNNVVTGDFWYPFGTAPARQITGTVTRTGLPVPGALIQMYALPGPTSLVAGINSGSDGSYGFYGVYFGQPELPAGVYYLRCHYTGDSNSTDYQDKTVDITAAGPAVVNFVF